MVGLLSAFAVGLRNSPRLHSRIGAIVSAMQKQSNRFAHMLALSATRL
jgi:hypothetical protein